VVSSPRGDEFSLESVGPEPRSEASSGLETRASGPSACQDSYYNPRDAKVYDYNRRYANTGSIPDNVTKFRAVGAMKRGGTNIFKVKDSCGLPDRVKGVLRYKGGSSRSVDINSDGTGNANDGKSVIGFGDLPSSYMPSRVCLAGLRKAP
jgi:hypothetical protein